MGLVFANPTALWALLGLPAIILLHFLQSRNREARASTLFLLERVAEDTRRGAVITRLRNGSQLWLQLLSILLLTWLLAQPMRMKEESVQDIAVVVDTSSSMQAFPSETREAFSTMIRQINPIASTTRWWLLPSDSTLPRFFAGTGSEISTEVLNDLRMTSVPHDPSGRLREARSLVGPEGLVIFLTDHPDRTGADGPAVRSVGTPFPNVGLSPMVFEKDSDGSVQWKVNVINFSDETVRREVRLAGDDVELQRDSLLLAPGGVRLLTGVLPEGVSGGRLSLEPEDRYSRDDTVPFVVPVPKPLRVHLSGLNPVTSDGMSRVVQTVPGAKLSSSDGADVTVRTSSSPGSLESEGAEVFFLSGEGTVPFQRILPSDHPLVSHLNWDGLVVQPSGPVEIQSSDRILLRMGEVPLVLLRKRTSGDRLIFNLDPASGNVMRNSAIALLLNRFLTGVQESLDVPVAKNMLTGQPVRFPEADYHVIPLDGEEVPFEITLGKTPEEPGWMVGRRDGILLFEAGIAHGDMAEGDFQQAGRQDLSENLILQQRSRHVESDLLVPLWMVLLFLAVLGSWRAGIENGRAG